MSEACALFSVRRGAQTGYPPSPDDANFTVRDSPEEKLTALKPFDAGETPALPVRRPHNGHNHH